MWLSLTLSLLTPFLQPTVRPAVTPTVQPAVARAPAKLTADELVGRVQAYYQKTTKLQANFRQEYTNTTFGKTSRSDGKLYIAKPGKMRWDYARPERKFFISDGTTLWVYEQAAKQAFKQDLRDQILPVAISFLYGTGDLANEFRAALDRGRKYGAKGDHVVKLTPKKPSTQYKHLWLVIDPTDFHVKQSIILEASDNLNRFTFLNIKQNSATRFSDRHFKFVPPKGVKVIRPE